MPWRKFVRNDLICADAALVVVELGVDLQASAGLQHDRFGDRLIIAQGDQRLGHS